MRRITITMLLLVAVAAAGCGSDGVETQADTGADDTAATTTSSTEAETSGSEVAERYFTALSTISITDDQDSIDASREGTPARDYATMQNALALAQSGSAGLLADQTLEVDGSVIRLCDEGETGDQCVTYGDLEVDGNQLTDFTINGEDPRARLSVGGNPVAIAGITYTPIGAYQGVETNRIYVAYKVENAAGAPLQLSMFSESYVDASGQQFSAADSYGPTSAIQPGANATAVAVFDGATIGGQLGVNGYIDDSSFTEAPATLTIAPPAV